MMIPHYYEDPHTLHVGTMPNRAYYIPASRRSDALVEHRETSDRFQLLNGSWKFRYYASIYDLQDAFYEVGYDASAFDSIPVPSVWQNHGYDHHQYTNIRYAIIGLIVNTLSVFSVKELPEEEFVDTTDW